ncbi:methyltransferase, putative [Plasmodium gallinaceum]|uniref:tRNA N(3)-methylcytidine methyltransferase n=1 Tax=Plasmodium gallinaceum TaxID=5849 RepID=A0A1J1GX17_PLAGA|nr:methyltransferase, putative [Plasmodium gallinaceum]CRG97107.1 methyltransferase, putative [Plasmodium gallinaceum]
MRPFYDSDIVVNFTLSEEAIQNEKRIIENNRIVVRDCHKQKLISEGKKNWDKFYNHYKTNFFKDRKWIKVEFDHIFKENLKYEKKNNHDIEMLKRDDEKDLKKKLILEIGCGVGNSLIPLLIEYHDFDFIGIDFSKNAINFLNEKWKKIVNINNKLKDEKLTGDTEDLLNNDLINVKKMVSHENNLLCDHIKNNDANSYYEESNIYDNETSEEENSSNICELKSYKKLGNLIKTCVVDITADDTPTNICELETVDIILLIFVLSSVQPDKMKNVINNSYKYLKKGGYVLLRDYGLYDLAQVRFANKREKKISENFYVRGDKTFVYFFRIEELRDLFCQNSLFEEIENKYITRIVKNRKRNIEMKRIWVQSIFKKV